jgi:hypothetical protein
LERAGKDKRIKRKKEKTARIFTRWRLTRDMVNSFLKIS